MCDLTMALMAVSTATSAIGTIQQGQAEAQMHNYNAGISHQNAVLADQRAKDAIERGQFEENRAKQQATALRGRQENTFASANLDTGYGSPLDIIVSSAMAADQDAAIIRMNAEREAEDFEMQAHNYRSQGKLDKASASNAKTGSIFAAAGTVLDGGAGIMKYKAAA